MFRPKIHPATGRSILVRLTGAILPLALAACGGGGGETEQGSAAPAAQADDPALPATDGGQAGGAGIPAPIARSAKRGLAYGGHSAADLNVLSQGVGWWYNWSPAPEAGAVTTYVAAGVEFVPMVWGGMPNANEIANQIPATAKYLLGFNEPNFISQANKTPSQAAALWPVLEAVASKNKLQIGAPALNYCGDCVSENGVVYTDPVTYLDAFLAVCKECRIDFIPVHWYACNVDALKWYIGRFKKYNKPIWVTEFACGDNPHDQITLQVQKNYMQAAVEYMESEPAIARYAWFSGRNNEIPYINLLGADGELTELGSFYLKLPIAASD